MRSSARIFFSLLILLSLVVVGREFFSEPYPKALSRAYFDKSLGALSLGQSFVFQMQADEQIRRIAKNLIAERKKEWALRKTGTIPLTLHQIWPFEESLPDELARSASLLTMQHPLFSYKFWSPSEFGPLLDASFGDSWRQLSPYIIRDLAAAQILLQEGGIVVDLESECVHPLTDILLLGDCIIGFDPPLPKPRYNRRLFLSSGLIASTPGHRLISLWSQKMINRAKYAQIDTTLDPLFVCLESLTSVISPEQSEEKLILLGPTFFSPVAPANIKGLKLQLDGLRKRPFLKKILQALHLRFAPPFSDIDDETVLVHMHGGRQSRRYFEGEKLPKGSTIDEDAVCEESDI